MRPVGSEQSIDLFHTVRNATPCLVVEYVAPVPAEHAATATVDEYVTGMVSGQNAMPFYSYLGESEKQCIDKKEPCIQSKFRYKAETARLNEAPSVLSGGDSLIASALRCVRTGTTVSESFGV